MGFWLKKSNYSLILMIQGLYSRSISIQSHQKVEYMIFNKHKWQKKCSTSCWCRVYWIFHLCYLCLTVLMIKGHFHVQFVKARWAKTCFLTNKAGINKCNTFFLVLWSGKSIFGIYIILNISDWTKIYLKPECQSEGRTRDTDFTDRQL